MPPKLDADISSKQHQQKRSLTPSSKSQDRKKSSVQQSEFSTASSAETKRTFSTMSVDRKRKKAVNKVAWKTGTKKVCLPLRVVKAMGGKKHNISKSNKKAGELNKLLNTDLMKITRTEFNSTMDLPRDPAVVNTLQRVFNVSSGEQCLKKVVERPHFQDPIFVVGRCLGSKNAADLTTLRSTSEGRFRQDVKQEFSLMEHESVERKRRIEKLEIMKYGLYRTLKNNARELTQLQKSELVITQSTKDTDPKKHLKKRQRSKSTDTDPKKHLKKRQRSKSMRKTTNHKQNKSQEEK